MIGCGGKGNVDFYWSFYSIVSCLMCKLDISARHMLTSNMHPYPVCYFSPKGTTKKKCKLQLRVYFDRLVFTGVHEMKTPKAK